MSYNDTGYTRKTREEIIREKEELFGDLFDVINNSPSDILWQWMKNGIYEREEIESLHEIATEMMSISDATGAFLDKFGIECGIFRKGAQKAGGYVEVTRTISGVSFTIPAGTQFKSASNTYTADDKNIIPYEITMTKTKTGESDDYFSSDIETVDNVVEILDENKNVIDSGYYVLDSVYKNNIQWTIASSAVLIKDEQYTVRVSGNVTKRVEVSSEDAGAESNASIGTVTSCVQFPTLTVTNKEEITEGADQEDHEPYRTRLLEARRRTFTLGNIKSIILGLDGVRSCKVYQDVGTDQTSVEDWDNPTLGSSLQLTGNAPLYSQAFVPGDQIATIGRITLHGMPYNDPPAIVLGIKRDIDSVILENYYDYIQVEEYEIDQSITGMRDIIFNVKYNSMDKTKTYRFDIWCDDPENPTFDWGTHYWIIDASVEDYRSGLPANRGMLYEWDGSNWVEKGTGMDVMFKTHFNGAGFTCVVAPEDGYGFINLKSNIETLLDYVEGGGYSPVAIQSTILESDEVLIDVKGVIYITTLADFQNVRREVITSIEDYLESLVVGDNVIFSRIFQIIMNHEQVYKLEDLYIKRSTSADWKVIDIGIQDDEVPDIGTRSFQRG